MKKKVFFVTMVISFCMLAAVYAQEAAEPATTETAPAAPPPAVEPAAAPAVAPVKTGNSVGMAILLYLPNRICDIFDIVRARVRIGPGISVGARVTEGMAVELGAYRSMWLGLHGPRTEPKVPWPAGLEGRQGAKVIFLGEVEETEHPANYQFDEIGVDAQAAVAGVSVGVSISEIFDLVLGFLFIDISGDDF